MKILNLFAGIGGNRYFWDLIDHYLDITAVEKNSHVASVYSLSFPQDQVLIGDAWEYVRHHHSEYDIIWASPPCPTHSKMRRVNHGKNPAKPFIYPDMRLYGLILSLNQFFAGNWVVENVVGYYEPLVPPRKIGRHYFWSNISLNDRVSLPDSWMIRNRPASREEYIVMMEEYLGMPLPREKIYLPDTNGRLRDDTVFRNCIHPRLGLHVLKQLIQPERTVVSYITRGVKQ